MRLLAVAIVSVLGLSGCALLAPNRPVVLSSTPPGAVVLVDGRNSGFVTPCQIQLDVEEDVRLDFSVPGFKPETRYLTPDDEAYSILWSEMYVGPQTWHFPLWLPLRDFLVPVKWTEGHSPGRIHVELDRLSDEGRPKLPPTGAEPARAAKPADGTVPPDGKPPADAPTVDPPKPAEGTQPAADAVPPPATPAADPDAPPKSGAPRGSDARSR